MTEIVVDSATGRWYTVGTSGAEFVDIPKGSIVFNHKQSESLLKNGYVNGRGHAHATGTALISGSINKSAISSSNRTVAFANSGYSSIGNSTRVDGYHGKEAKDQFDFIETALNRIDEAIDRIKVNADSVYKILSKRNSALSDEIQLVAEKIQIQKNAYSKYMQEANAVGLSSEWATRVKNGTIGLFTVDDEELSSKINKYKDLYEKAIKANDEIGKLHNEIADLYVDRFDNISKDYENQISLIEHSIKSYENGIDQLTQMGIIGSTSYYKFLIDAENETVKVMQDELATLEEAFAQAMNSKEIEEYSDAWYQMVGDINSVRESIDEATVSIMNYANEMRKLKWDYFDYTQSNISEIITETEFLIDLLSSNKNLFDDNGRMNANGLATMGLRGENYNVYMAQADEYANEIKKLNEEIANDQINKDLIDRRNELLKLQRESILNAEKEKSAIVDLVSDGYSKQISALKELVDAYNDSLDSSKSLYDYQKKINEQTSNIASLQKQIASYTNDSSAEARAKTQKLQVELSKAMEDLQESQYDQYISDQKKLLDEMVNEYQKVLNERLDGIDALISDCITQINAESVSISDTLNREAENVGYTISEANKSIWSNGGEAYSIMEKYGDDFGEKLTSINEAINGIKQYTDILLNKANAEAEAKRAKEEEARRKIAEASKPATPTPSPTPSTPTQTQQTSGNVAFNEDIKRGVAAAIEIYGGARSGWGNDPERRQKLTAKFGATNAAAIQSYINAHAPNNDLYNYWISTGKSNLSKYYYSAFKKGTRRILSAQDAWTQEAGRELIVRPSENAMLTSMKPGDAVLTSRMTETIFDFAKNPELFFAKHSILNTDGMLRSGTHTANGGVTMGDTNIRIDIDHVDDYNDFVKKVREDPKFEEMIQSMTVGQLTGKSKFSKFNYNFK